MFGRFRILGVSIALAALISCATLPPLQEMSNARQTIAAAKEFSDEASNNQRILEAERLLARAERRIEVNLYDGARADALRAQSEAIKYLEESFTDDPDETESTE
ncbi:uncharacterized protein METZ01_LOCUS213075 [marine metagenome]|uniref:DUF4398 domain-containing protein n=1 Tax=marine metagenome TaxID=408172 RepID=A0A382FDX7_9ZZZZ|tara:strand:+ start:172 stop:486 length:315 start_codon:yes stop_codon:yes gene_type:complete